MLFYPGFGFILTDLDVFLQRDAVKENFVLGGTIDAFASLLTTSVQMRLMRYPNGLRLRRLLQCKHSAFQGISFG